ncbi:heavy metal-associated isoprenylated plant protein 7-like [Canna indica]|uniref:Heavy metal-associated isoprenylated plant protein 7-like n=1 Tax=Canna indica TaxID=4628 RepID=A0AAQ3KG64_9LILI|nr:heavy metal-associated isoprenylated plant protein 7-like [Canna indica]
MQDGGEKKMVVTGKEGRWWRSKMKKADKSPPPPSEEIKMSVFMHCEGCARKIECCLSEFQVSCDAMIINEMENKPENKTVDALPSRNVA